MANDMAGDQARGEIVAAARLRADDKFDLLALVEIGNRLLGGGGVRGQSGERRERERDGVKRTHSLTDGECLTNHVTSPLQNGVGAAIAARPLINAL
jgi:hypothetical protein